jgi:hypothetical protein
VCLSAFCQTATPLSCIFVQAPEEPFSWDLLRRLSGVDPREITGESANRLPNGLYGDEDDQSSFNMFAWYLEPEVRFVLREINASSTLVAMY